VLLFVLVPSPSSLVVGRPSLALLRRAAAAPSAGAATHRPFPADLAHTRPGPSDRRGRPSLKRALTPLIGPRWTDGPGPPHRSTALRQHRVSDDVSLRQPGKPQPATWRLHSSPAGRPGSFAKRTPSFRNSQPYPSTYIKAFQAGPCFYVLNPELLSFHVQQPTLDLLHIRPPSFTYNYV
jgi:hypothetical protein